MVDGLAITSNHYHELRANAKRQCRGQGQRRGQLPADLQQIIEHKLLAKHHKSTC